MSPIAVIIVLIAVVLTAVISVFATIAYRKSVSEAKWEVRKKRQERFLMTL